MGNPNVDQKEAGLMQMKINTRLTALQAARDLLPPQSSLMNGQGVDHLALLAMASDIELYVLGGLEDEAKAAFEAARKPKQTILQVRP